MRKTLILVFFLTIYAFVQAQLRSPEQFLGYRIGERFTPHWKVVNYITHVAEAAPNMVKLQKYGETNEGRPLYVVIVSSPENMQRLESIRQNNLRLAMQGDGGNASRDNATPIVWLSYNVHGNEASSTEASMLTLYELVNPSNNNSKTWLRNVVVVIDPCLNPDGRDRYVNWNNAVTGVIGNPDENAREHREPWVSGGRTNHYYFDLNRDWAWQTQVETQQRIRVYNEWLPQVHVDFHEQWPNSPYYFAPAAQPYHEVITPWQRDFQVTIGRNHAKYFDREGWLFFTKEYFDLLYPSYGDTYPIYNGSIGMTYEQAGHSIGGRALLLESEDTLTLHDRALHHYTTGMSTIEIASINATKLVNEFANYFQAAVKNGVGEYRSFVIRNNSRDRERINQLLNLLSKNRINFGYAKAGTGRGYNYHTGKEEAFNITERDIVISTQQPKGALAQVLFEPNTKVVDSNTYDITAWSLPYAYGLTAYAVKTKIETTQVSNDSTRARTYQGDPYGYVFHWTGTSSVRLVSKLLQEGIKLRFTEQPMVVNKESFDRGSILVLRTSNQQVPNLMATVQRHASREGVQLQEVSTGFADAGVDFGSNKIHLLKKKNIALLTGEGTSANASGEIWHFFDKTINYPLSMINLSDYGNVDWSKYDVLILVNGNYSFLNDKSAAEKLRDWISNGGVLIALENAVSQLSRTEWGIKAKKRDESTDTSTYSALRVYENRERDFIPNITPGSIYKVDLDATHPLAFGYPNYYYTLKQDDNIYEFLKDGGWNVGVIKKNSQLAGFVGSKLKSRLNDGVIFGVQDIGSGKVVYLADNLMFRGFWENGKLMFANALFFVGN